MMRGEFVRIDLFLGTLILPKIEDYIEDIPTICSTISTIDIT